MQDGFLNVLVRRETEEECEGWVQQFALPPTSSLDVDFISLTRALASSTSKECEKMAPRIHEVMS